MCGSLLFSFLLGVVAFKIARRIAWARHHGCGGHGGCHGGRTGGCHGGGRFGGWQRRGYYRWGAGWSGGGFGPGSEGDFYGQGSAPPVPPSTGKAVEELIKGMELNQRQRAEAQPVLALLKNELGPTGPAIEAALGVVAADTFDPARAGTALHLAHVPPPVQHAIIDGLEHFHNIIIPEQRESLREALKLPGTGAATGTSTPPDGGKPQA